MVPAFWVCVDLHTSVPANPLLAEPMYLKSYIERLGTGTADMVRIAREKGLTEPDFRQDEEFRTIVYRTSTGQATGQATGQVTGQVNEPVEKLVAILIGEKSRDELMSMLDLKHREHFMDNYLNPAIERQLVQPKHKSKTHPNQKYLLTEKGLTLQSELN